MSVFLKRSDWYIDYYFKGKRRREKIGPSKKLAQDVLHKRKVEIAENRFLDVERYEELKFKDFASTYLESHAKVNKRSWKKSDVPHIKQLNKYFRNRLLHEITPFLIESYKKKRSEVVAPATVNRELACLSVIYTKAVDWGKAGENPCRKVKKLRENNRRVRYLNGNEITILLNSCPPKLRKIVTVALLTGMRKGEIQNLRFRDINFQRNIITLLQTKSGRVRHIPMHSLVKEIFENIERHPKSELVFSNKQGNIYWFSKEFNKAVSKAGILDFRFHDCRHSFASHLAMAQVSLNTIRELLGHTTLTMTLRYAHLSADHKTEAIEVLGRKVDTYIDTKPASENTTQIQ